jgi:hypothetical protein
MNLDRTGGAVAAAVAAGLVVCCGLPVLLSVGTGIAFAGLRLRSWGLAAAGSPRWPWVL